VKTARHLLLTLAALGIVACGSRGPGSARPGTLQVVATTSLVADVVRNVGGSHVSVVSLMGAGVDPHLYRAKAGDVGRLSRADVVFFNGLHLEAKLAEVLERLGERRRTIAITGAIDRSRLLAPPEFAGAFDPHVWFDVALWAETLAPVRAALADVDPVHAAEYAANEDAYRARLLTLHDWVGRRAGEIPAPQRVLVTAHDAFNYFGRAYGFEVRGLQGISTASEAGTGDVQALADFVAERHIPALFVESSVPRRSIEAVQAAVRARSFSVAIGGQLYSDALGDPGTPAGTYEGMVRQNVDTIVDALKGGSR
jgi:manganese/zinc/iron transport system substrate-binding protein